MTASVIPEAPNLVAGRRRVGREMGVDGVLAYTEPRSVSNRVLR